MRRAMIRIPAPKARPGQTVQVLNYRCRPPRWDQGEVLDFAGVEYRVDRDLAGSWTYTVLVPSLSGKRESYRLSVDDDGIRPPR